MGINWREHKNFIAQRNQEIDIALYEYKRVWDTGELDKMLVAMKKIREEAEAAERAIAEMLADAESRDG